MALGSENSAGLPGVVLVAVITSIMATLGTLAVSASYFAIDEPASVTPPPSSVSASAEAQFPKCGALVYSPVQNTCVDQAVFDGEMQRLFKALGIDPSIYQGK